MILGPIKCCQDKCFLQVSSIIVGSVGGGPRHWGGVWGNLGQASYLWSEPDYRLHKVQIKIPYFLGAFLLYMLLYCMLSHSILLVTLWVQHCYPYLIDEESQAHRDLETHTQLLLGTGRTGTIIQWKSHLLIKDIFAISLYLHLPTYISFPRRNTVPSFVSSWDF